MDFEVSIHVPNEGNDIRRLSKKTVSVVSIHVPNEGNDFDLSNPRAGDYLFQSTFPMKGTTRMIFCVPVVVELFQSTFPMKGTTYSR